MGNTISKVKHFFEVEDHPHIHGEYHTDIIQIVNAIGSPPHTWGILELPSDVHFFVLDHPHIHGEYLGVDEDIVTQLRITPTYMGNTRIKPDSDPT